MLVLTSGKTLFDEPTAKNVAGLQWEIKTNIGLVIVFYPKNNQHSFRQPRRPLSLTLIDRFLIGSHKTMNMCH